MQWLRCCWNPQPLDLESSIIPLSRWYYVSLQQCGTCDQQSHCLSLEYSMTIKLLTEGHLEFLSLKGDCTGSSESTLVKMPHCWKSLIVVAHVKKKTALYVSGFPQAWKVLEFRVPSWKVIENEICREKYWKITQRPWKVLEFFYFL